MKMYTLSTFWKDSGVKHELATMSNILYALSIYYEHPDFLHATIWEEDNNELEHVVFQIVKED